MFETILGNEPIKTYLRKAVRENLLSHTLLFSGPDGIGKSLFAKELAKELLKAEASRIDGETHPDFYPIRPEGKSGLFTIETLRSMIDEVHKAPFEAPGKVFLLYDAERMQPAAANAILKTLEEPSPNVTFILLTRQVREILPTIVSRCSRLSFQRLKEEEIAKVLKERNLPEKWAKFAEGSLGKALELTSRPFFEEALLEILTKRPPFHARMQIFEKIEEGLFEEDPVRRSREIDQIFAIFLIWHRDQELKKLKLEEKLLFPEWQEVFFPLPSLSQVEKGIERAKLAISRNMKLSFSLEELFSTLS